ncbi:MAG: serine/threonine protein kinase [Myxococcales bacterium]|nr:serine/threonine protein kinase [Myxococcales bacterium]
MATVGGASGDEELTRVDGEAPERRDDAPLEVPPEGRLFGRYTLLRPLGRGGMGTVYAAYDEELDRKIAIKLLRGDPRERASEGEGAGAGEGAHHLLGEAQALARLSHPNVVQIYDVGVIGGQVFLAMEYVQGKTLREWEREAPRSWREVVALFRQAGEGLAAAHDAGLVHRDFKPDNVLVGEDGRVRVLDFGLAARRERGATGEGDELSARTLSSISRSDLRSASATGVTRTLVGTPAYMSPEQHLRLEADGRSDLFAFCVALYEALHGERPSAATPCQSWRRR